MTEGTGTRAECTARRSNLQAKLQTPFTTLTLTISHRKQSLFLGRVQPATTSARFFRSAS